MDTSTGEMSPNRRIVDRYVSIGSDGPDGPRYMNLPVGILSPNEAQKSGSFASDLVRDAQLITDSELRVLLRPERALGPWRNRLVAGYLIAIDRRTKFRHVIGDLLLSNEVGSVAQGYCFALAAFGEPQDVDTLAVYLDENLGRVERRIDQSWALGAIRYLDRLLGIDRADAYVEDGSWERWARAVPFEHDLELYVEAIETLCHMRTGR